MKSNKNFKNVFTTYFFYNFDRISASISILIGLTVIFLSYIGKINQIFIGITLVAAPFLYFVLKSRLNIQQSTKLFLSFRQKWILNFFFWVLILAAIIIWNNQLYSRPIIFFIIISVLAGLIAIDILFYNENKSSLPILIKIFILAFLERLGVYYNFPSLMGYDSYVHVKIANLISNTGLIPPSEISNQYANYPILHIFIAINKLVMSTDIKNAVVLSIGFASIFVVGIFIFLIAKNLAGPRIGLTSVFLILLTSQIINMGLLSITAGSLVLCYFLTLVYLIITKKPTITILFLQFFITFMVIITHQLSTFVVFLIFCILYCSRFLYEYLFPSKSEYFKFCFYLMFFGISIFMYWTYTIVDNGTTFFDFVITPLIDTIQHGGQYGSDRLLVGNKYAVRSIIETAVLQVSYLILPFLAFGGLFYWMTKDKIKFSFAIITSILFFLMYAIPLMGVRNLLTDRWAPFLSIFLGILAAVYIIPVIDSMRSIKGKVIAVFSIMVIFSFLMYTVPMINKDNPLISKETTVRNQFRLDEISALQWIGSFHGDSIIIDPSFVPANFFYGNEILTTEGQMQLKKYSTYFNSIGNLIDLSKTPNSLIILRKVTFNEPITMQSASNLYGDTYASTLPQSLFDYFERSKNKNLIFTNGNVIGYSM